MVLRFTGLNHLALATGDMDRTIRFWRDLVGMKLIAAMGEPGFRRYVFAVSEGEYLIFFEWPGIEPIEEKGHGAPARGKLGFDHVSFGLDSRDGLFELKDRLNAADIWVSEVIDHGFILSIYTYDPNGIAVEFSVLTGEAIGKPPIFSDPLLSIVAAEGPERNASAWPEVLLPTPEDEQKVYPGEFFFTRGNRS